MLTWEVFCLAQDTFGNMLDLCRTQEGSRFIQEKLGEATPEEV